MEQLTILYFLFALGRRWLCQVFEVFFKDSIFGKLCVKSAVVELKVQVVRFSKQNRFDSD